MISITPLTHLTRQPALASRPQRRQGDRGEVQAIPSLSGCCGGRSPVPAGATGRLRVTAPVALPSPSAVGTGFTWDSLLRPPAEQLPDIVVPNGSCPRTCAIAAAWLYRTVSIQSE